MASFDIINAAGSGYRQAWRERHYLLQLAAVPLLIKFVCMAIIVLRGWNENFLRQGMVMLPAYFADGWMLSHYVRLLFLGQRWPFQPRGDRTADHAALQDRMHGVMAGTLVFALSMYILNGVLHVCYKISLVTASIPPTGPVPVMPGLAALAIVILGFWGFRFLWFYIPASLGYNLRQCNADIRGGLTSFFMIATALICFLPVQTLSIFIESALNAPFPHGPMPLPIELLRILLRTVIDTTVSLISTGGMAYAFRAMIETAHGTKKPK